jgi:hypothetical protein
MAMLARRDVIRLLVAGLVLPLMGKGALATGVGLGFDMTLVSTRALVDARYDGISGRMSGTEGWVDVDRLGLGLVSDFEIGGLTSGDTVTGTFRRERPDDWSLTLPVARYDDGVSIMQRTDMATGLSQFLLSNESHQIDLDFIEGTATITNDSYGVVHRSIDGSWVSYQGVRHVFDLSNVIDRSGSPTAVMSLFASATAYSSFGPHAATLSARDGSAVVPLPAALVFALTGAAALAGLRRRRTA